MAPTTLHRRLSGLSHSAEPDAGPSDNRADRTRDLLAHSDGASAQERREIQEQVILANIEVAETIVLRYRNRGVESDELAQIAYVGLVKAAQGFDPSKSDNFLSYAVPTIRGEVKRFFRDHAWMVRPPRRIQELQASLSATAAMLTQETGHVPSARELADELCLSIDEVKEALATDGCFRPSSLDAAAGDDEAPALAGTLGQDDAGYDRAEAVVALRPLCRNLSARDRRIVYLRFFEEWTQAQIAQELGVTQMQVSRLIARILTTLRAQVGATEAPRERHSHDQHEPSAQLAS
ncbi:MAG: SigB/SigF/SigG family RNA polymerase sigma factor [Nocardioidaceae bacterium]